jgi:hypothetical protein
LGKEYPDYTGKKLVESGRKVLLTSQAIDDEECSDSRAHIGTNHTLASYSFTSIVLNFEHHSRMMGGVESGEEETQAVVTFVKYQFVLSSIFRFARFPSPHSLLQQIEKKFHAHGGAECWPTKRRHVQQLNMGGVCEKILEGLEYH